MEFNEALVILESVKQDYGFPALLETMEYMQDNLFDFTKEQRIAYGTVFNGMAKLFAPA